MKASFVYALRYQVKLTCKSPMRSGGTDRNPETILRRWDGTPMLQGTSLAGAMRDWFEEKDADTLFGSQQQEGAVSVSDLVFEPTAATAVRPRLRIDGATGTADARSKFDVMHLEIGTNGSFSVIWKGSSSEEQNYAAEKLEQCFAAMHSGLIRFGAQKSNGFGRIEITDIKRRCYDMKKEEDRTAWIEKTDGVLISLPEVREHSIILHVSMQTDALLVKSGTKKSISISGADGRPKTASVTVSIEENGKVVIPGSSLKGSVRAQVKRSAPFFGISEQELDDIFGRESSENDNGIAGKILFSDGIFQKDKRVLQTRIHIDRLSGSVKGKAMAKEQIVGGLCEWDMILSSNLSRPERTAALLLFALRDLGIGLFSLGSGYAVGRGRADSLTVTAGTSKLTCKNGNAEITDESGLFASWLEALRGETI